MKKLKAFRVLCLKKASKFLPFSQEFNAKILIFYFFETFFRNELHALFYPILIPNTLYVKKKKYFTLFQKYFIYGLYMVCIKIFLIKRKKSIIFVLGVQKMT